jgi:hypothetical protein
MRTLAEAELAALVRALGGETLLLGHETPPGEGSTLTCLRNRIQSSEALMKVNSVDEKASVRHSSSVTAKTKRRGRPRINTSPVTPGPKQLAKFLDQKDLTNAEAGKLFRCSPSYVSMLLSEQVTPGLDLASRIQKVTGIECRLWIAEK